MNLFGGGGPERYLLKIYADGSAPVGSMRQSSLVKAGILKVVARPVPRCVLDRRHPAFREICETLRSIASDAPFTAPPVTSAGACKISPSNPLGTRGYLSIRVLMTLVVFGPLSLQQVVLANRDVWSDSIKGTAAVLRKAGIVHLHRGKIQISAAVPRAYLRFVRKVWDTLEGTDHRFPPFKNEVVPTHRAAAFTYASDEAPRIFGTDARLRNLMALAKYGPLHMLELRRIVGSDSARSEDRDNAPYGRAGIVRTWGAGRDRAAMLNPKFPVYGPLRALLLALEKRYPLPTYVPRRARPVPPSSPPWNGDKTALFGSPIPTAILTSIGVNGWTFEALCVRVATGYDRVVVKKALHRLEREGVLQGDRARKPGYNVRVITIATGFPARHEFEELLRACVRAWPQIVTSVEHAIMRLPDKTKVHLGKRGLLSKAS